MNSIIYILKYYQISYKLNNTVLTDPSNTVLFYDIRLKELYFEFPVFNKFFYSQLYYLKGYATTICK